MTGNSEIIQKKERTCAALNVRGHKFLVLAEETKIYSGIKNQVSLILRLQGVPPVPHLLGIRDPRSLRYTSPGHRSTLPPATVSGALVWPLLQDCQIQGCRDQDLC